MPNVLFLSHKILLPKNKIVYSDPGISILDIALKNKIRIEHACGKSCACTTCHCIITKGFSSLSQCSEKEEDALDKAWGVQEKSRLACQALLGVSDIEVLIPLYNTNYV